VAGPFDVAAMNDDAHLVFPEFRILVPPAKLYAHAVIVWALVA
jgi:hypothetical protein